MLDKNPLEDIKNTNTIKYVMKNGRMYDANNMSGLAAAEADHAALVVVEPTTGRLAG